MRNRGPIRSQGNHESAQEASIPLSPKNLLEIGMIDILILGGGAIGAGRDLDNATYKRVEGQVAQEIATLFRQLPSGEPARCHIPPYGLRFYTEEGLQKQCSICWMCNNICGDFQYSFDANHAVSQSLLALISSHVEPHQRYTPSSFERR